MIFSHFRNAGGRLCIMYVMKARIVEDNLELARYIRPTMQKRTM